MRNYSPPPQRHALKTRLMTDFSRDLKGVALKTTLSRTATAALALLTILPVAKSESVQPSWYFTGGSKKLSAFIDLHSLKRVDDYAIASELLNFEVEQFSEEGAPYLSALALTFFDCVKRQSSMFKLSLFTEL